MKIPASILTMSLAWLGAVAPGLLQSPERRVAAGPLSCEEAVGRLWDDREKYRGEEFVLGIAHNLSPATTVNCGSKYLAAAGATGLLPHADSDRLELSAVAASQVSAHFQAQLLRCGSFETTVAMVAGAMEEMQRYRGAFLEVLQKNYPRLGYALATCASEFPALREDLQRYLASDVNRRGMNSRAETQPDFADGRGTVLRPFLERIQLSMASLPSPDFRTKAGAVPLGCDLDQATAPTMLTAAAYVGGTVPSPAALTIQGGKTFDVPLDKGPGFYVVNGTINQTGHVVYVIESHSHTKLLWITDKTDNFVLQVQP